MNEVNGKNTGFLGGSLVKKKKKKKPTWQCRRQGLVLLDREDSGEKEMATHSSILSILTDWHNNNNNGIDSFGMKVWITIPGKDPWLAEVLDEDKGNKEWTVG